mmetsp:Transcript_11783/g.43063  ORF Transcript_11783/g.43063 Transcript_11783/m.43063 type:complete len:286 (+) Transcript_11783:2526-3383(+)
MHLEVKRVRQSAALPVLCHSSRRHSLLSMAPCRCLLLQHVPAAATAANTQTWDGHGHTPHQSSGCMNPQLALPCQGPLQGLAQPPRRHPFPSQVRASPNQAQPGPASTIRRHSSNPPRPTRSHAPTNPRPGIAPGRCSRQRHFEDKASATLRHLQVKARLHRCLPRVYGSVLQAQHQTSMRLEQGSDPQYQAMSAVTYGGVPRFCLAPSTRLGFGGGHPSPTASCHPSSNGHVREHHPFVRQSASSSARPGTIQTQESGREDGRPGRLSHSRSSIQPSSAQDPRG